MKKIKSRKIRIRNQLLFKLGILFLVVGGFIGRIGSVEAGMNDSSLEKNRVEGVYAVTTLNGVSRIFYLNMYQMNGKPSYCIELGVDITTSIYHSTGDFSISHLSSEQIEYIRSISYFGYQYVGHDDYRYYMAAQELIWEYLNNTNVEWTNVLDVNGERIDISAYKAEILEKRKRYYSLMSVSWIDGQKYYGGEKIVLNDMAGVLSDYEVVSSGHSKVFIDGNVLTIHVSNDYVGAEEIILKKKNYYSYDSVLYYYGSSQQLISNGNFKELPKRLYFSIIGRMMTVQVVDKETGMNIPLGQASLAGAEYELYNSKRELVGTYITDLDGMFEVENIPYGTYYIKQIKASEGYLLSEEEMQVVFSNTDEKIILEQEVISNIIQIQKVYGSFGKYEAEEGIVFEVIDWTGTVSDEFVTDREGIASIRLPYGRYTISQKNTLWGYSKVEPFIVEVLEIKENKIVYNLVNDLIQCKISVVTLEQESGKSILGDGIVYRIRKKDRDDYIEFEGNSEFIANSDGSLVFPMLFSYGDYVIEQFNTPNGVFINSEVLEISINEQTDFELLGDELYVNVEFYNQFIRGKVEVLANEEVFYSSTNYYDYKKEPRKKIQFLLVASKDIVVNGEVVYYAGEKIEEFVTNDEGIGEIKNLYLGDYCLIEVGTDKSECFSLVSTSNRENMVEKYLEITKVLDKGELIIENKDESGDSIAGSVFEVYNQDNTVIYTGVTNDEGLVQLKDLVYGNYCIQEKHVSKDWQLISDEKCISLEGDKRFLFVNKRQESKKISVPNTFSEDSSWLGILFINVFGVIGMMILVYQKIFKHR